MGRAGQRGPYGIDEDSGVVSPHAQAARARLERLEHDPRVRTAALVCSTFHLDPVAYLDERDPFKLLLRIAAHNVVQTETSKASKATKGR